VVELAEDEGHLDVVDGHGVAGVVVLDGLETGECAFVVEVVEAVEGVVDLGGEIDGVGVGGGVVRLSVRECRENGQQDGKYCHARIYRVSGALERRAGRDWSLMQSHILRSTVTALGLDLREAERHFGAQESVAADFAGNGTYDTG
jgi:hypothetical protein